MQRLGCLLENFPPAPDSQAKWGADRRAGRWPRAAAPAPWLCPLEPSEPLLPRGARAVMFFLPPTFESPLPLRAHSSSRHNLRAPDLGGAPQGAQSVCKRGRRKRPVPRSVSSALCLSPHLCLSIQSFHRWGAFCCLELSPWTFPQGALNFGTCHPKQFYSPADRMKREPQVPPRNRLGAGDLNPQLPLRVQPVFLLVLVLLSLPEAVPAFPDKIPMGFVLWFITTCVQGRASFAPLVKHCGLIH